MGLVCGPNDFYVPLNGSSTHTDGRGHFYAQGLSPGTYAVAVTLPMFNLQWTGSMMAKANQTTGEALAVFSGNQYRLKDAAPIKLSEGDEESIEITIPVDGLCAIHGTVTAKADGQILPHGTVYLLDATDKRPMRWTEVDEDGDFDFRYVVPGNYLVKVQGPEAITGPDGTKLRGGFQTVTVPLVVQSDIPALNYALALSGKQ